MIEHYRFWYEHERDCNAKMLAMIESVPDENRSDSRFQRALDLAAHMAACRENWLDRMTADGMNQTDWNPQGVELASLRLRFEVLESKWTAYLDSLSDDDVLRDFEFPTTDGSRFRWNIEGQIIQLVGHAFYHRGQVALLVDALGGETVDTDYLFWAYRRDSKYGKIVGTGQ
jgi:uncharacterized damage-inducible protein DinB